MKQPLVTFNANKDVWFNGQVLAKVMQAERQAHALRGFFFDYGTGETSSHRNFSEKVNTSAGFLMAAARDTKRAVRVYPDRNGCIAASLVEA
jgi:hypothetical protein